MIRGLRSKVNQQISKWYLARLLSSAVLLDTSTVCTARCVYCVHQRNKLGKPQLISKDIFRKVINILAQERKFVYLYQSGDPFLHPDIVEFIISVALNGMDSSTATKLYMPIDFEKLDRGLGLCDATGKKAELLVTLDSFNLDKLKLIAPGINLLRVKGNLSELAKLQKHSSFKVVFTTVVNRYNEDDLNEIKNTLLEYGFKIWSPKQMGYYMPYVATQDDINAITDALPRNPKYRARFDVWDGKIVAKNPKCDTIQPPVITPNGDVAICCHDMLHKQVQGNILKEGSLRKIMQSRIYKQSIIAGRRMELDICQGCN